MADQVMTDQIFNTIEEHYDYAVIQKGRSKGMAFAGWVGILAVVGLMYVLFSNPTTEFVAGWWILMSSYIMLVLYAGEIDYEYRPDIDYVHKSLFPVDDQPLATIHHDIFNEASSFTKWSSISGFLRGVYFVGGVVGVLFLVISLVVWIFVSWSAISYPMLVAVIHCLVAVSAWLIEMVYPNMERTTIQERLNSLYVDRNARITEMDEERLLREDEEKARQEELSMAFAEPEPH